MASESELLTVVETPDFIHAAADVFDDVERLRLIAHLAARPTSGVVIPGAGGVRKLRWAMEGRGKRGGARVIYYFADRTMPVFLLKAYSKSVRTDITPAERREFNEFAKGLRRTYRRNSP